MKTYTLYTLCVSIALAGAVPAFSQTESSSPQRGHLVAKYGITQQQEDRISWFSWIRSRSIDSLASMNLTPKIYRAKRDSVTTIYYSRIESILTPEQKAKFNLEAIQAAKADEVKILKLPVEKEIAMGALKAEYEKSVKALEGLPYREMKQKKAAIETDYRVKLKSLLGEEKYSQWLAYKNSATERKFKKQFGFNDRQFEKFKELENRQAVKIMLIKNTASSPEERIIKIAEAKQEKVDSLKNILTEEQFGKWYEYYRRKESEREQRNK